MELRGDGAAELISLPFAPGESPFRVKGTAYRGHLEYTEKNVAGGVAGMLADFRDPRLRHFFEQPFLAATLYDVFPLAIAGIVCAARVGQPFLEFVRVRSEAQAKSDVSGVYKVLLALTSPEAVAARLPRLVGQYFDFGQTELVEKGPGRVVASRTGLPRALAPWYATVSQAYVQIVVAQAGGKDVRSHVSGVRSEGQRAGLPIVTLDLEVTWR